MKKNLLIIFSISILLLVLLFIEELYFPKVKQNQEDIFLIEKGSGVVQISQDLKDKGFIENDLFFNAYVFLSQKQNKLQAGTYFLDSSMSVNDIVSKFTSGDVVVKTITIPEGFTQEQIEERLGFKLSEDNLNGYLFPDTYHFSINATPDEVLKKMLANFEEKLTNDLREEITNQNKTLEDIIKMASLLEKEVITLEDKKIVSGILWKRLSIGMALQVDSARETYERRGLPSNPICNPGIDSIEAAIYSETSPYFYYLSASDDGRTIFSRTLEEHNINRAKYLK
jgi:UPF0755 protein